MVSCGYPYSGLYANAHRGKVRKAEKGQPKLLIIEEECPSSLRRGWAAMIRKVYEVDPLYPGQVVWVISGF